MRITGVLCLLCWIRDWSFGQLAEIPQEPQRSLDLQVGIATTEENIYGIRHATAFVKGLTPLSPRSVGDTIDVPRQAQI